MGDLAKEEPVELEVTEFEVGAGMSAFPGCYTLPVVIIARILETRRLLVDPLETSTALEVLCSSISFYFSRYCIWLDLQKVAKIVSVTSKMEKLTKIIA